MAHCPQPTRLTDVRNLDIISAMPGKKLSPISRRLRKARKLKQFSRRALSVEAGYSQSFVGQIERGDLANPTCKALLAICRVLGVDPAWMLTGKGTVPTKSTLHAA